MSDEEHLILRLRLMKPQLPSGFAKSLVQLARVSNQTGLDPEIVIRAEIAYRLREILKELRKANKRQDEAGSS